MAIESSRCDPARLRSLLEDRLDDQEQEQLARHLERCETCRLSLEEMAAASRWWGDARLLSREVLTVDGPHPGRDPVDLLTFLDPPTAEGQLGMLGPYEVLEVIGRGGMGLVLKANDRPLNRS